MSIKPKPPCATIIIENAPINILIDSGASVNFMDENNLRKLDTKPKLKLKGCWDKILTYGSATPLQTLGTISVSLEPKVRVTVAEFHVVKVNTGSLLSYKTACELGLIKIVNQVKGANTPTQTNDTNTHNMNHANNPDVFSKYPMLWHGIGKMKRKPVNLHIDSSVNPVAHSHRRIPFNLRKSVENELDRL